MYYKFVCLCDGLEGLCLLLRWTSYPCRYSDIIPRFPRPVSVLSLITNEVLDYIYDTHSHLVTDWNRDVMTPAALQTWRQSSYFRRRQSQGKVQHWTTSCFGFIDETVRPISRPGTGQRVVYNGHKMIHGLKFQSVTLPNGLTGNIFGPVGEYVICNVPSFTHKSCAQTNLRIVTNFAKVLRPVLMIDKIYALF